MEALFAAGDRRAAQSDWPGALRLWQAATLQQLPQLRGLAFQWPVKAHFMDRAAITKRMRAEVDKEWPGAAMAHMQTTFEAFGLIAPEVHLGAVLTALYAEQVAGFYDPDTKELVLVRDTASKTSGLLSLATLAKALFSDPIAEQKMVLAHELTHALDDQHFDLFSLQARAKTDDDVSLALAGLVEGEAMVIMLVSFLPESDRAQFLSAPPEILGRLMAAIMPIAARLTGGDAFGGAPAVIQDALLVPYVQGLSFVLAVLQEGGWAAINRAFADPPISSEQILHPERYLDRELDPPLTPVLPAELPAVLRGFATVQENCMGELAIRAVLQPNLSAAEAADAAAGWDGDTYRVMSRRAERWVAWATIWENEAEAQAFETAVRERYEDEPSHVLREFNRVVVVLGAPPEEAAQVAHWARAFVALPKVLPSQSEKRAQVAFPATPDPAMAPFKPPRGVPIPSEPPGLRPIFDALGLTDSAVVNQAEAFSERACACPDRACGGDVVAAQDRWYATVEASKLHPLDFKRIERAARRMLRCVAALNRPTGRPHHSQ